MAYNNYFPQYYPGAMPTPAPQQANGINWVVGENEAKIFPVAPGQSALMMDKNESIMYIKSVDLSGMALPLRIFDYTERQQPETQVQDKNDGFISRTEFDSFKNDILNAIKQQNTFKPNYNKKPKEE